MKYYYFGNHEQSDSLIDELLGNCPDTIAFDCETISLTERMPIGLSISVSPTDTFYFPCYPNYDKEVWDKYVWPIMKSKSIKKVAHNILFDMNVLNLVDCEWPGMEESNIADTNIMAHLLGYEITNLEALAEHVGRVAERAPDTMKKWYATDMLGVPEQAVAEKCANDSQVTLALYWEWVRQIDNEYHDYFEIEMQSIPIILRMSNRGLKIDQHRRQQLIEIKTREVDYYRNLCDGLGFKPGSPQQVAFILMKRGTHLPMRRQKNQTTGKWGWKVTTDEDALEMLDDPVASWVLEYRKNKQLLSTFLLPYDGKDRIYTNFNFDAKVGRISSSNINLQNVPPAKTGKDAAGLDPIVAAGPRAMILPDTGCFTNADASQEHLRILSHRSGDEAMMYIYSQPTYLEDGSKNPEADIHTFLAKRAGISRKLAKTSNYTICYGADAKTLMGATKIKSVQQNEHLITLWSMTFPTAWKWLMEAQAYGVRTGWSMPTLFGRRIKLPPIEVDGIDGVKRKGANYPILGSDGEIMKRALIHCQDMPLALTVHDSMMFDGDVKDELLRRMDYLSHISEVYIPWDIQQTLTWE